MEVLLSNGKSSREIIREKREKQKRQRFLTVLLVSIVAIVLFSIAVFLPKILISTTLTNGFSVGDPNAPITVVEFSSYLCDHCKTFSDNNEKGFIADYVQTGDVYFTYMNIPDNDEQSLSAAEASYCAAEQNKFFEFKEYLFNAANTPNAYTFDNLINYASLADLDTKDFQFCLESDEYADAYLSDYQYAGSVGVSGTPSFLVNETLVFSEDLISTVESLLKQNLR